MGIKLESCRYGYKLTKALESSWKQLWSHLAGRKAFREHLANVMSVSIEKSRIATKKTVYKSTCKSANLQWPSDHLQNHMSPQKSNKWLPDYVQPRNSLRKVTSSSELNTYLRKRFQPSLISISLSVRSLLWISIGLSVRIEDLNCLIGSTWIHLNIALRTHKDFGDSNH